jgi:transcriptional regulator GlxA family with amidase domain
VCFVLSFIFFAPDQFKADTGMAPNDYLLRCRIRKAQDLLDKSGRSVTDIGLSVGFPSGQYFSQVFRKYTGKTPTRYRASRFT